MDSIPVGSGGIHKLYLQSLTQKDAVEKATIEVEKIHGPLLLLSGDDDSIWPSGEMADAICDRLKEKGFRYKYEHLKYKDAGHVFSEHSKLGGTAEGNKQAGIDSQEKSWKFLPDHRARFRLPPAAMKRPIIELPALIFLCGVRGFG